MIFEQFANLKYKYGNRHFWCRGYYVDTSTRLTLNRPFSGIFRGVNLAFFVLSNRSVFAPLKRSIFVFGGMQVCFRERMLVGAFECEIGSCGGNAAACCVGGSRKCGRISMGISSCEDAGRQRLFCRMLIICVLRRGKYLGRLLPRRTEIRP